MKMHIRNDWLSIYSILLFVHVIAWNLLIEKQSSRTTQQAIGTRTILLPTAFSFTCPLKRMHAEIVGMQQNGHTKFLSQEQIYGRSTRVNLLTNQHSIQAQID